MRAIVILNKENTVLNPLHLLCPVQENQIKDEIEYVPNEKVGLNLTKPIEQTSDFTGKH